MIDVYYASSVISFAPRIADYLAMLDSKELATAERFKLSKLKDHYIICHGILRQQLASYLNDSAAKLSIARTDWGKPFLSDYPELSFNMSHSRDILAIAISSPQCQIGIDIECYKARSTLEGLVKKCFAPEEIDYWASLNKAEQDTVFYQFWVNKEAFVKAVGKGITLGLNQCVINPDNLNSFLRVPELAGQAEQWHIHTLKLPDNQFGAVVCNINDTRLRLIEL